MANHALVQHRPVPLLWDQSADSTLILKSPMLTFTGVIVTLFGGIIALAYALFPGSHTPPLATSAVAVVLAYIFYSFMFTANAPLARNLRSVDAHVVNLLGRASGRSKVPDADHTK